MKHEFYYTSRDSVTKIHAIEWLPDREIKGVLQICHGMVEYIDRYDEFAEFMSEHGYYVVGHDHLGHGKSIQTEADLGYFDERKGNQYVIGDIYQLQEMTRKKKIGVLMSLHELDLAERVSDKIVCVKGENIEHYGTPEEVFTDGFVDQLYEITDGTFQEKSGCVELKKCGGIPEVFVIAGNGTGSFLFRQLQRNGIPFAVGILGKNDIDYPAAEALAVQVIAAEAYQDFERQHYEAAKQVMCACRKVICCQTVFGSQNVLNRQLLQEAEDCGMEIELWQK